MFWGVKLKYNGNYYYKYLRNVIFRLNSKYTFIDIECIKKYTQCVLKNNRCR